MFFSLTLLKTDSSVVSSTSNNDETNVIVFFKEGANSSTSDIFWIFLSWLMNFDMDEDIAHYGDGPLVKMK
jgi:hypothetical protein